MIRKSDARKCLQAMRRIADGEHATKVVEAGYDDITPSASHALHDLWWMHREHDYFAYTSKWRDGQYEYRPDQVLVALALCVAIAADPPHRQGKLTQGPL